MIDGVNHITLSVQNLNVAFDFYTVVLGLKALAKRKDKSAYLLAGNDWIALVEAKNKSVSPTIPTYAHVAFSVSEKQFKAVSSKIKESGAKVWQENASEGDSLYFLDPSGNQLEIHIGNWESRIQWLRDNPSPDVELFV